MTLSVSSKDLGFDHLIVQQTAAANTGHLNVASGITNINSITIEKTGGTAVAYLKVYEHDGDGWSASSLASLLLPLGGTTGRVEVDLYPAFPVANGLTFAAAQEDGDVLTTTPDASLDTRMVLV